MDMKAMEKQNDWLDLRRRTAKRLKLFDASFDTINTLNKFCSQ